MTAVDRGVVYWWPLPGYYAAVAPASALLVDEEIFQPILLAQAAWLFCFVFFYICATCTAVLSWGGVREQNISQLGLSLVT